MAKFVLIVMGLFFSISSYSSSIDEGKLIDGYPEAYPDFVEPPYIDGAGAAAFDIEAGPIWNDYDAQNKCPAVCSANNGFWTGEWRTTIWNVMSVCNCVVY